jgi:hypothetical protein
MGKQCTTPNTPVNDKDLGAGFAFALSADISFAAVLAVTVYVIVDLEYPRIGLINISDSDQVLVELCKSME